MSPLISAQTLLPLMQQEDVVLVDCRHQLSDLGWGRRQYQEAHLPGAVFMHLDEDLSGPKTGHNGRHPLPDPQQLAGTLAALGISNHSRVIAYDDPAGVPGAARLWWLLGWLGHSQVQVLDGGFPAWLKAAYPVNNDLPKPLTGEFTIHLQPDMLVDVDAVQRNLVEKEFLLVDARSAERYQGQGETLDPVGGHIPGAANHFFLRNLEQGYFKAPACLRADWLATLDGWPQEKVVHQCGSGVTACQNMLALASAGMPGGRLYAGSWSEWCADPARPVARD